MRFVPRALVESFRLWRARKVAIDSSGGRGSDFWKGVRERRYRTYLWCLNNAVEKTEEHKDMIAVVRIIGAGS